MALYKLPLRRIMLLLLFATSVLILLSACASSENDADAALPTRAIIPTLEPLGADATNTPEPNTPSPQPTDIMPTATNINSAETEEAAPTAVAAAVTEIITPQAAKTEIVVPPARTEVTNGNTDGMPSPAETEPVVILEADSFRNESGDLWAVVTSVQEGADIPILPEPPEGQRWIVLDATLANLTGQPMDVTAESLTLLDVSRNPYTPVAPEEVLRPPLIGAELNGEIPLRAVVRFAVPDGAMPAVLEWCPEPGCTDPIQTRLP